MLKHKWKMMQSSLWRFFFGPNDLGSGLRITGFLNLTTGSEVMLNFKRKTKMSTYRGQDLNPEPRAP